MTTNGTQLAPAPDPETRADDPVPPRGVFIRYSLTDDGQGASIDGIEPVGDVRVTEFDTVLDMALAHWRAQLQLSRRDGP